MHWKQKQPAITRERLAAYVGSGLSAAEIAEKEGCHRNTVGRFARKYGLKVLIAGKIDYRTPERKRVLEAYIADGLTTAEIADKDGLIPNSVNVHLRFHGLTPNRKRRLPTRMVESLTSEEIEGLRTLIENGLSARKAGATLNLTPGQMTGLCKALGVKTPKQLATERRKAISRTDFERMIAEGMCVADMGRATGVHSDSIAQDLKRHGLVAAVGFEWKVRGGSPSPPAEHLKARLTVEGIAFEAEYRALTERRFSIDIAFPSVRLGLEVNGNFHYEDTCAGKLAPYYQERHDTLTAAGWTIIEIPFRRVWDEDYVKELLGTIRSQLQKR